MKKANKLNNKGFTLMELIIVVAILAILIALIAPNLIGFLDKAESTSYEANAKSVYTASSAWVTQERVSGHKIVSGEITATTDSVTKLDGTSDASQTNLVTALSSDTFGKSKAVIKIADGKVSKVEWYGDGSTLSYTYPDDLKK